MLLEVKGISKSFFKEKALNQVQFNLNAEKPTNCRGKRRRQMVGLAAP